MDQERDREKKMKKNCYCQLCKQNTSDVDDNNNGDDVVIIVYDNDEFTHTSTCISNYCYYQCECVCFRKRVTNYTNNSNNITLEFWS